MAITVSTNGDNRIVTLKYEALATKVDPTVSDAAKWFYHFKNLYSVTELVNDVETRIDFDNLTNDQKLNVIFKAVKDYLINAAKQAHINESVATASLTAQAEAETNYSLNG